MYGFVSGPLVWIAFIVFVGGMIYQFVRMLRLAKKDKVVYPYLSLRYGLRSLVHWTVPFASLNMRKRYETTIVTFAFHVCLILVPIVLTAHVVMFSFAWGPQWVTLSEKTADVLTVLVILALIFFLVRRWMLPEVRFVTNWSDYLLLVVILAPFITGFMAHRQWFAYETMVTIHMICGAVMLMAIPFTRLSHMLFFPFTRVYMGSEFGAVRHARDWQVLRRAVEERSMGLPAEPLQTVADPGLDETAKNLTTAQIAETINRIIDRETAARFKVYLNTCVHCGLCSDACHWFLSNDRDPRFSPVGKVKQTLWEILRKKGKVDPWFIKECSRIAHTECNVCRRCSMYCPFGIDIAYLLLVVRRICSELGMVPQFLQDTVNSHAVTLNQMWVKQDEWIDTLQWQEEEARGEVTTARIPLDKEGAEVFYSVIAPEPKILAQLIGNMAQIMAVAKVDWTMPSFDGWDNSNMAMYSGDFETMGRVERAHHEAAMKLKARRIVMGECGHAFRGAVYDGPKWLAWRQPPIPVIHAVDFYHELITSGRITIARKYEEPVTVQEPCNIVRGRGLGQKLREIIQATCADFRAPEPELEHNYCCGAGGGVINCGPPWKTSRVKGNSVKAEQLARTKAHVVITPCHNCHSGIEDIIGGYKLGMHVKFFSEILMEVMEIPDELKGE